LQVIF